MKYTYVLSATVCVIAICYTLRFGHFLDSRGTLPSKDHRPNTKGPLIRKGPTILCILVMFFFFLFNFDVLRVQITAYFAP